MLLDMSNHLDRIPDNYNVLLEPHKRARSDLFSRVKLNLKKVVGVSKATFQQLLKRQSKLEKCRRH